MRLNITLPEYVVKETDRRAAELGISRSGYIAAALAQKAQYDDMMTSLPQMMKLLKEHEAELAPGQMSDKEVML